MNSLVNRHFLLRDICVRFALIVVLSAGLASQASAAGPVQAANPAQGFSDPLEEVNRSVTDFNLVLDDWVLRPVAGIYRAYLPGFVRNVIHNFTLNLSAPVTLANDLLQGNIRRAQVTTTRFVMNSTIGVAGMFDVATYVGIRPHSEDFGQTLAVWGLPKGPFLVLPVLGPMYTRHAAGRVVDVLYSPLTWSRSTALSSAVSALHVIDVRAERYAQMNDLIDNSLDFYAVARSLYRQNRNRMILNGETVPGQSDSGTRPYFPEVR